MSKLIHMHKPLHVLSLLAGVLLTLWSPAARAGLSEDVEQSMVRIYNFLPDATGRNILIGKNGGFGYGMGTGFVVSNEGHIITNQHVIEHLGAGDPNAPKGAMYLVVSKQGKTYKCYRGKVLWENTNKDMAIMLCPELKVRPLQLNFQDIPKGTATHSMGYPSIGDQVTDGDAFFSELNDIVRRNSAQEVFDITSIVTSDPTRSNLFEATMTTGVIEKNSPVPGFDDTIKNPPISVWYHNLDIRKGNSGGPFFNSCGQVTGVVGRGISLIKDNTQRVTFAMRITEIKDVLDNQFKVKYTYANAECKPGGLLDNRLIIVIAVSATVAVAALLMAIFKSPRGRAVVSSYTTIVEDKVRSILRRQQAAGAGGGSAGGSYLGGGGGGGGYGGDYGGGGGGGSYGGGGGMDRPVFGDMDRTVPGPGASLRGNGGGYQPAGGGGGGYQPAGGGGGAVSGRWTLTGRSSDGRDLRIDVPAQLFVQNGNRLVLGRSQDLCHIVVSDSSVSKQHAQIRISGGQFFVADRNSANGTMVNGHLCKESFKETPFREGDTLVLGEVRLFFQRA